MSGIKIEKMHLSCRVVSYFRLDTLNFLLARPMVIVFLFFSICSAGSLVTGTSPGSLSLLPANQFSCHFRLISFCILHNLISQAYFDPVHKYTTGIGRYAPASAPTLLEIFANNVSVGQICNVSCSIWHICSNIPFQTKHQQPSWLSIVLPAPTAVTES